MVIFLSTLEKLKEIMNPSEHGSLFFCRENRGLYIYDPKGYGQNDDKTIVKPTNATGRFFAVRGGDFPD